MTDRRIEIARFGKPHGVRGLIRLTLFAEDVAALSAYGPLGDASGQRQFAITPNHLAKGVWVVAVAGIENREAAAALAGTGLFIDREALPAPDEEEYYHADLIGLAAETGDGSPIGEIVAVHDFGGGASLEIRRRGQPPLVVPFTRACVPVVEPAAGRVVVVPPEELD